MILQDICFSNFNYQSNRLEYLLSHTHLPDKAGWVSVDVLCEQYGYRKNILNVIVTLDDKKRFIFSDDKTAIRLCTHVYLLKKQTHPTSMTNLQILFETQAPLPPYIGYVIFGALTEEFSQCPEADTILEGGCPEYIEMNDDWDVELKQLSVSSFPPPHTAEPYYPPEYIEGHVWDAPCSVFALCAILYEILTDELPYIGAMPEDMLEPGQWAEYMSKKRREGHLDLTSIPPALHGLMTKGLQLQRKYRYRSLKTLFKDFAKLSYEDVMGDENMY